MRYLAGRFITFFLTAYLLAGCLSCASTPLPASVIDNTCPPPCWAGITPRASTLPQAQSIIRSLSDVDLNSIKQGQDYHQESDRDESGNPRNYERSRLMLSWNFSTTITHNGSYTQNWLEFGGAVYFDNDQVDEIDLAVPHASGLSIATAIKRFGPPTKVLVCSPGGELADFVKLIYPTQGLVLSVYNTCPNQWSTNSLTLSRDLQVTEIVFFDPSHYEDILLSRVAPGMYLGPVVRATRLQKIQSWLQDWRGFQPQTRYTSNSECWR